MRRKLKIACPWSLRIVAALIIPTGNATFLDLAEYSLLGSHLPEGTCSGDTPCVNAACCSIGGVYGYSPAECGKGNCTLNCEAKAQCGPYAKEGAQTCPLDVCSSKFG